MADSTDLALPNETLIWARESMKKAFEGGASPQAMGFTVIDQLEGKSKKAAKAIDVYFYQEVKSWPMGVGYTSGQQDGLTGAVKPAAVIVGCHVGEHTPGVAKHTCKGTKLSKAEFTLKSGTDAPDLTIKLEPCKLVYHEILEPAAGKRSLEMFALIADKQTWKCGDKETDFTWTNPTG